MLLEIHSHSAERSGCSRAPAAELVRQALARNLQGIVLTDHHYRWDDRELAELRRGAGVPRHFALFSGQEVSTPDLGHVLVLGSAPSLPEGTPAARIRERFPQAALVRAHPYRHRLEHAPGELCPPLVDAVEIFSANHTLRANCRGLEDWHRHRFTAVAGTDAHGQVDAGTYPTQLDHPVGTIDELAREVRGGRCRPLLKELTLAGANSLVTEIVIGTKGEGGGRPRIVLRRMGDRASWERAVRAAELGASLAAQGFATARFRLPALLDVDAERLTVMEEGLRGRPLLEALRAAGPAEGRLYLELAAGWLARLHATAAAPAAPGAFLGRERRRLDGYIKRFGEASDPRTGLVRRLAAAVLARERRLVAGAGPAVVRCHGDFHPKNVIVGQDRLEDRQTAFVAAVDLEGALPAPRAYDVGWFLAHYRHQLAPHPGVLEAFPPAAFREAYRAQAGTLPEGFERQVDFFEARAMLSIASYLVRLGLGQSAALAGLLDEARGTLCGDSGAQASRSQDS